MTKEDKDLLLKDLCARLPYGVKVRTPYNDAVLVGIIKRYGFSKGAEYIDVITDKQTYPLRYIQPYLRPMSSMTEEEKKKYNNLKNQFVCRVQNNNGIHYFVDIDEDSFKLYDWLNVHHFDYRGLIEKGLAIEVTKENNHYEKEQKEK